MWHFVWYWYHCSQNLTICGRYITCLCIYWSSNSLLWKWNKWRQKTYVSRYLPNIIVEKFIKINLANAYYVINRLVLYKILESFKKDFRTDWIPSKLNQKSFNNVFLTIKNRLIQNLLYLVIVKPQEQQYTSPTAIKLKNHRQQTQNA